MKALLVACLLFVSHGLLYGQSNKKLQIHPLCDNFYVYTTYRNLNGQPFPSNSMYLVTDKGVVMFDTPWDTTQFQPLLDSIEARHHQPVVLCISTHFHADRTAGLDFFKNKGIKTYSSKQTYDLCREKNEHQSAYYFTKDTTFTVGKSSFHTFYGGPGHSPDNIVIWFDKEKILYGGCLIKSLDNNSLGNIEDANLAEWPKTMKRVIQMFPHPRYVIPGHFAWGDKKLLTHTLRLLQQNKNRD